MSENSVEGFAQERFASVRDLFAANLANGTDLGASFAVTIGGETVVDLWGGWADAAQSRRWKKDTIANVYSTTKTLVALTALLLADRGELDWDAPIVRYWPEFAAEGKSGVKVRHLMSHMAGLPHLPAGIALDDIYDWDKMTSLLAAKELEYAPGSIYCYHANTQGYLIGEVVRRITGRSIGKFFREELAEPLGADFYIGLPASEDARVAELIPPITKGPPPALVMNELIKQAFTDPARDPSLTGSRAWRGAEMPATNGHGNARSIARLHSILANGGVVDGHRFLSEAGCRKALELQFEGLELHNAAPMRQGMGFYLLSATNMLPGPNVAWGGGLGGSLAVIDFDQKTTFAYVMNKLRFGSCVRGAALTTAVWSTMANEI
jgi:CubicO group peptidase (beta-lactamase class C family)